MRYQIIQHLKRGTKRVCVSENMFDALLVLSHLEARFQGLSYVGSFPIFEKQLKMRRVRYTIQGLVDGLDIVCSLAKHDIDLLTNPHQPSAGTLVSV